MTMAGDYEYYAAQGRQPLAFAVAELVDNALRATAGSMAAALPVMALAFFGILTAWKRSVDRLDTLHVCAFSSQDDDEGEGEGEGEGAEGEGGGASSALGNLVGV